MFPTKRTKTSFKPTVEALEERALMSGAAMAPASPLAAYAAQLFTGAYHQLISLENLPSYAVSIGAAKFVPATVGAYLAGERQLETTMRWLEQVEPLYELAGYDSRDFRIYDAAFHLIDQAVTTQAVLDMQWYYANYGTKF